MLHNIDRFTVRHAVPALGKFGKYKKEAERAVLLPQVRQDPVAMQLVELWKGFELRTSEPEDNYQSAVTLVRDASYSAATVQALCIAFAELTSEHNFHAKAGVFLSALINSGKDKEYVIITEHLPLLAFLAYRNTKDVMILGNAGSHPACWMGSKMGSGTLTIDGNVDSHLADMMEGGTIIVKGNTLGYAGKYMTGGKIIIEGDACGPLGSKEAVGEIHVEGRLVAPCFHWIEGNTGLKVYHKGKIVFPSGGL